MIGDALHIGHNLQCGRDCAQVACQWLLQSNDVNAAVFNPALHGVHGFFPPCDCGGGFRIWLAQHLECVSDNRINEMPQINKAAFKIAHFMFKQVPRHNFSSFLNVSQTAR